MDAYRFSIAWSRIFPSKFFIADTVIYHHPVLQWHIGLSILLVEWDEMWKIFLTFCLETDGTGEINQAGVDHYNNFINALLAEGIFNSGLSSHGLTWIEM